MNKLTGKVLWWDSRDGQGIIIGIDTDHRYYIDSSVISKASIKKIKGGVFVKFKQNNKISDCLCAINVTLASAKEILKIKNQFKSAKLRKVLKIVNKMEKNGIGFFDRRDNNMNIWIRAKHINDPDQWSNANKIAQMVGAFASPQPDALSGHLLITLENVYG